MKFPIVFLLVCLSYSCTRTDTITRLNAYNVLKDSICLTDIDGVAELSYGQNDKGNLTISYYSSKRDKIYTRDIENGQTSFISVQPGKTGRYFYVDRDSTIYILNERGNYITILKDGNYRDVYITKKDSLRVTYYSSHMPFKIINEQVLLQKLLYLDLRIESGRQDLYSSEMLYLYVIGKDSLIETASLGAFPPEYLNSFQNETFPKSIYKRDLETIYYLFNNNNTIYEYDVTTKKSQIHDVTGLAKNNRKQFDKIKITDLAYSQTYVLENTQYYMMLRDDVQNMIIVIQAIGIPATNTNGELNLFTDQPYLVYTINNKYEVDSIIRFENINNHKFPFAYCHDGLLYVPGRDVKRNMGENELTIYVYKIS